MKISNFKIGILIYGLFILAVISCRRNGDTQGEPIDVEVELPADYKQRDIRMYSAPTKFVMYPLFKVKRPSIEGTIGRWHFRSNDPILLDMSALLGKDLKLAVLEPGDSVKINFDSNKLLFSGRGCEKLQLITDLKLVQKSIPLPVNPSYSNTRSVADYFEWNAYLNKVYDTVDTMLSSYESKINRQTFDLIKEYVYSDIEYKRLMKFGMMVARRDSLSISQQVIEEAFDSTIKGAHLDWLFAYTANPINYYVYYDIIRRTIERKYHFDYKNDSLRNVNRKLEYADLIKKMYEGEVEQSCLTYLIADQGLKEHVLKEEHVPVIDSLLRDYYARPGYEEYKDYMRSYEEKVKKWIRQKHKMAKRE